MVLGQWLFHGSNHGGLRVMDVPYAGGDRGESFDMGLQSAKHWGCYSHPTVPNKWNYTVSHQTRGCWLLKLSWQPDINDSHQWFTSMGTSWVHHGYIPVWSLLVAVMISQYWDVLSTDDLLQAPSLWGRNAAETRFFLDGMTTMGTSCAGKRWFSEWKSGRRERDLCSLAGLVVSHGFSIVMGVPKIGWFTMENPI